MWTENFRQKGKRQQLIKRLIAKGIDDENVLQAMGQIPRHLFIDSAFEDFAYEDKAFPIAADQTISHPYTVAFQSSLLHLSPSESVLEIGTGCGYQTAVLIAMGAKVYTIERQQKLVKFSRRMFQLLELSPVYQTYGDGFKGLPTFAPFDKIIVTAGSPIIPKKLLQQLRIGGIAVVPIGENNQKMYSFLKVSERKYEQMEFGDYKFVPMLEQKDF